jgi:DnaJ-domain-containing protein 1
MGAADLSAWRRQNSDPVSVIVVLLDGSILTGTLLLPRDRQLRDLFNTPDAFIDFDDFRNGPTILGKSSIRSIRANTLPQADQIEKRLKILDKSDPFQILGVAKDADRETLRAAYVSLVRTYHPDRFAEAGLPVEVTDYINTMARRINAAYSELQALFGLEKGA